MPEHKLYCRTATTFLSSGALDEEALAAFLQKFADARIGPYVGSTGSGEGHALLPHELRRIYEIALSVCRGRVEVASNSPEQVTAEGTLEHIRVAVAAGVDLVNIYGPDGRHGYRPTDAEVTAHFDTILNEIRHPAAVAPNPVIGYTPKASVIADICRRHRQVVAVNLVGVDEMYFLELKERLDRDIALNVPLLSAPVTLTLGAAGIIGGEFNILPKTLRLFLDCYERGDQAGTARAYADLKRFTKYCARWNTGNPRWIKMAMKILKFPGGEGGLRRPYIMAPDEELAAFRDGLLALRIPEIDEYARTAGLALPLDGFRR